MGPPADDAEIARGRVVWEPARSLWFGGMALAAVAGALPAFTPSAAILAAVTTAVTLCAGHSVGIHRGLIHRAFRAPPWLERTLVYLGVLVGLGGPIGLVRMHNTRDLQQNAAACHDYFAHRRWAPRDYFWNLHCRFDFAAPFDPRVDPAVERDPVYRFLERTWRWQQLPWALLFFAVGGWPWLVWGVCVRVTAGTTGYWLVNYAAHRWGYRAYENRGAAVQGWNVWLLGALSMGEGWHNNHHAFPRSARLGQRWWELDLGWWLVAALRAVGLARDVRLADAASRAATTADVAG